jgi:hypothetical protein
MVFDADGAAIIRNVSLETVSSGREKEVSVEGEFWRLSEVPREDRESWWE